MVVNLFPYSHILLLLYIQFHLRVISPALHSVMCNAEWLDTMPREAFSHHSWCMCVRFLCNTKVNYFIFDIIEVPQMVKEAFKAFYQI